MNSSQQSGGGVPPRSSQPLMQPTQGSQEEITPEEYNDDLQAEADSDIEDTGSRKGNQDTFQGWETLLEKIRDSGNFDIDPKLYTFVKPPINSLPKDMGLTQEEAKWLVSILDLQITSALDSNTLPAYSKHIDDETIKTRIEQFHKDPTIMVWATECMMRSLDQRRRHLMAVANKEGASSLLEPSYRSYSFKRKFGNANFDDKDPKSSKRQKAVARKWKDRQPAGEENLKKILGNDYDLPLPLQHGMQGKQGPRWVEDILDTWCAINDPAARTPTPSASQPSASQPSASQSPPPSDKPKLLRRYIQPEAAEDIWSFFQALAKNGPGRLRSLMAEVDSNSETYSLNVARAKVEQAIHTKNYPDQVKTALTHWTRISTASHLDSRQATLVSTSFRQLNDIYFFGVSIQELKQAMRSHEKEREHNDGAIGSSHRAMEQFVKEVLDGRTTSQGRGYATLLLTWLCKTAGLAGDSGMNLMRATVNNAKLLVELCEEFGQGILVFVPSSYTWKFRTTPLPARRKVFETIHKYYKLGEVCKASMEGVVIPVLHRGEPVDDKIRKQLEMHQFPEIPAPTAGQLRPDLDGNIPPIKPIFPKGTVPSHHRYKGHGILLKTPAAPVS